MGNAPEPKNKALNLGAGKQPFASGWSWNRTRLELLNRSVCMRKRRLAPVQGTLKHASAGQSSRCSARLELGLELFGTPAAKVVQLESIPGDRISNQL